MSICGSNWAADFCRGFDLRLTEVLLPVPLRCQVLDGDEVIVDQGHGRCAHCRQLASHLPANGPDANNEYAVGHQRRRRNQIPLADGTVG
jgi:hypothetical protein